MSAWLKVFVDLPGHPKITRLSRKLGADRNTVVGSMVCLWLWAISYAQDGDLSEFDALELAEAAHWQGDPKEYVAALKETGWLDKGMVIHDWKDYSGRYFHDKVSGSKRKSLQNEDESPAPWGGPSKKSPLEEKRREEKELSPKAETVFNNVFWPNWPTGGAKKMAKQRFLAASPPERERILAAERHYSANVNSLAFTVRAENFVGGMKSYYEEWADGPPPAASSWFHRNGNGSGNNGNGRLRFKDYATPGEPWRYSDDKSLVNP